ncbi:MAG: DUF4838 domain-containing protein, partial [Bacteroidetes bacterium]|nr:DUF4838 domain-containing protein [Bacteroidota bacterium]
KNILVDICPINQSFEKQLGDSGLTNTAYADAIRGWRQRFAGDIGLYSYYRKYAWHSMPVVIPRYIQQDLQWCAALPLQGVSTYAEPGDWYSYELNHYALAGLAWNPAEPIDTLINEYAGVRYGKARATAIAACRCLEEIAPRYSSIPYTSLKSPEALAAAERSLRSCLQAVTAASAKERDTIITGNLQRLGFMLRYVADDLAILQSRAAGAAGSDLERKVHALVEFLQQHADKGIFASYGRNNASVFLKHYNNLR